MPRGDTNKRRWPALSPEVVGAVILGTLAAVAFYVQATSLDKTTTARETFLFNTIQFVLTLGFGWCITRAASQSEFSRSLKRFAISAYRRISDIDQMVGRLAETVVRLRSERGEDAPSDLDVVEAIVLDTRQTIRSSVADWADVIADELEIIENIQRLENEKEALLTRRLYSGMEMAVQRLDERIAQLAESLPVRLAEVTRARMSPLDPRLRRIGVRDIGRELLASYRSVGGLIVEVRWEDGMSPRAFDTLRAGEELRVVRGGLYALDAVDSEGRYVGRCLNRTSGEYPRFSEAMTLLFEPLVLQIELVGPMETRRGGRISELKTRVVSVPRELAVQFVEQETPQSLTEPLQAPTQSVASERSP